MLVAGGYDRKIHSHLDCYISLDGVYVPIKVIGCWLPPLSFTKQDLSIQEDTHIVGVCYPCIEMET